MQTRDHSFAKGFLLTFGTGAAIGLIILVAWWISGRDSGSEPAAVGTQATQATRARSRDAGSAGAATPAPAFTLAQLAAPPSDDWITNGGSLSNQRYSPLDEISKSNVGRLKGVWLTHLRNSATGAKYSAESQPLEYKGVIYVPTGEDDVFAVSVATGRILWQYKANLDQRISTVCCGWESRGVALGEGKVYIGQLDGKLVALD